MHLKSLALSVVFSLGLAQAHGGHGDDAQEPQIVPDGEDAVSYAQKHVCLYLPRHPYILTHTGRWQRSITCIFYTAFLAGHSLANDDVQRFVRRWKLLPVARLKFVSFANAMSDSAPPHCYLVMASGIGRRLKPFMVFTMSIHRKNPRYKGRTIFRQLSLTTLC